MPAKRVLLLRGFVEDQRTSMALYADGLFKALVELGDAEIALDEFTPRIPGWLQTQWGMRFARYVLYPLQAPRPGNSVRHIMEHGYAHLIFGAFPGRTVVTVTDLIPLLRWKGRIPGASRNRMPVLLLCSL